jgi:hypothetical protein
MLEAEMSASIVTDDDSIPLVRAICANPDLDVGLRQLDARLSRCLLIGEGRESHKAENGCRCQCQRDPSHAVLQLVCCRAA